VAATSAGRNDALLVALAGQPDRGRQGGEGGEGGQCRDARWPLGQIEVVDV
jgi:hypothetical protein